jgi:hypothetical protein
VTYLCFDYDNTFQFTGTDKTRGALSVDTNGALTGRLDLTHFEPGGTLDFSACCAAVQARRLQLEFLQ